MEAYRKPYLYPAVAGMLVVVWALAVSGGAIANGHPTYWFAFGLAFLGCGTGIVVAIRLGGSPTKPIRSTIAAVALAAMAFGTWWFIPLEATEIALGALQSDDVVAVASTRTEILLSPSTGDPSSTGLIFLPGGKVDARAYARILRPIAAAGHEVVIVKPPLGVAFLAPNRAATWADEHPDQERWIVAGHSLGGVVAAQNASNSDSLGGLVLWASYPAEDVSDPPFEAVSVFGTNDVLTTLDAIEASRSELPLGTVFVAVEGAIHGFFGDYGDQPGDGQPGISREDAQDAIVDATLEFLIGLG